jgi:hypothetical protein
MQGRMAGQGRGGQNRMQQGGSGGPMGGQGGGAPGAPANNQPPDFRRPEGAVQAFLDAVKAHDLSRVTDATALRAGQQNETAPKHQVMFRRVVEGTLSESELNSLASKLENYRMSSANPAKSSGRLDIILSKRDTDTNSMWTIKVTVRREKKGWGVCDISEPAQFKNPTFMPRRKRA